MRFIKNWNNISNKSSLIRLLIPFKGYRFLTQRSFAIRIVLFQTLYYFLWSVTLVITHRIVNGRQVIRSLKKLFVAWISSVNYPVPGISKCLSMENFPKGFLCTYGDICLFLTFFFPITIVISFISFMIHEGKKCLGRLWQHNSFSHSFPTQNSL